MRDEMLTGDWIWETRWSSELERCDLPYFLRAPFLYRGRRGGMYADETPQDTAVKAREVKAGKDKQRLEVILAAGVSARFLHQKEEPGQIAKRITPQVKNTFKVRELGSIEQDTVRDRLKSNWAAIAPALRRK